MGLESFLEAFGGLPLLGVMAALTLGGFIKGVVGFALPLISLSLMGSFLPYEVAVALLILPTFASNATQGFRNGFGPAMGTLRKYWRLNLILVVTIALAAQLVVVLPESFLFGLLGVTITVFSLSQIAGWQLRFKPAQRNRVETGVALTAGFFGGLSGVWGPPLVMYMLAAHAPKVEMVRMLALSFMLGSVVLISAHLASGVLNEMTLPVTALGVIPTMAAMFAGFWIQDRLDQELFRKLTLIVLTVAGLNLLRRALMG